VDCPCEFARGLRGALPLAVCCSLSNQQGHSTSPYGKCRSKSGSSRRALKIRSQTPFCDQRQKRIYAVNQLPNASGRSRHGEPVRAIQRTASIKSRLSRPRQPGSPGLPDSSGAIRSHSDGAGGAAAPRSRPGAHHRRDAAGDASLHQALHGRGGGLQLRGGLHAGARRGLRQDLAGAGQAAEKVGGDGRADECRRGGHGGGCGKVSGGDLTPPLPWAQETGQAAFLVNLTRQSPSIELFLSMLASTRLYVPQRRENAHWQ